MSEFTTLNYVQIGCGLAAAICVFIGLFLTIRKMDKEDKTARASTKTIVISTVLVAVGLMFYSGVRTCSLMVAEETSGYDPAVLYISAMVEVGKSFGFLILAPVVLNLLRPQNKRMKK